MNRNSHWLGVLGVLPELSAAQLVRILTLRAIPASSSISLVEAARALTTPGALWRHLEQKTRRELEALGRIDSLSSAEASGFVDELLVASHSDGFRLRPEIEQLWPEVAEALENQAEGNITPEAREEPTVEPDPTSVFGNLETVEKLLWALDDPLLSVPDVWDERTTEKLQAATGISPGQLQGARDLARALGWIRLDAGVWKTTPSSRHWRERGAQSKWQIALDGFAELTPGWWPATLPSPANAHTIADVVQRSHPLVSIEASAAVCDIAEALGLIRDEQPTVLSIPASAEDRAKRLEKLMPQTVDSLYPDGPDTLVAAGPLSESVEQSLRQIGQWVSGGLTPRFRVTPRSILAARQSGWAEESITSVLRDTVVGGLHSALGEQVSSTLSKAATLTLRGVAGTSVLEASEEVTAAILAADRRLESAQLQWVDSNTLQSPRGHWFVHELLLDEGYPHLVVDENGQLLPAGSSAPSGVEHASMAWSVETVSELIESWRGELSSAQLWLEVVEDAVSHRTPLSITVQMHGGKHTIQLAPQSLSNGRLRGIDSRSDVERTIPMSHVLSVGPGAPPRLEA